MHHRSSVIIASSFIHNIIISHHAGLLFTGFVLYSSFVYGRFELKHWYTPYVGIAVAVLCYINGQFYLNQIVAHTSRKDEKYSS